MGVANRAKIDQIKMLDITEIASSRKRSDRPVHDLERADAS